MELLGGVAGAEVLGDVGEHYFGKKGKVVGQFVGGFLGGWGASKGASKMLPDKLAGPLEGADGRGWTAVKGMFGGGGGVEAGPGAGAADGATVGTSGAPGRTAGEPAEPLLPGGRTQADVDRANAKFEEMKQGWRRGDDLPGQNVQSMAQDLLDAIFGRGPRPAFAGAMAGGGAREGRPAFDEGGVFSPKKGGSVLGARGVGRLTVSLRLGFCKMPWMPWSKPRIFATGASGRRAI